MKLSPIVQKWTIVVSAMLASIVVIFLGIYARNTVLEANPCQMTYSKPAKTEVPLCGKTCEYKLYKISNPNAKTLNPQPVLYIPGHLGSANQARSLASYMHDDTSYFQYFALDFNEGFSAFHGGDVFAQAHATNRAIQKIVSLYAKKKDMKIDLEVGGARKVMLVGHSVGGIVARATALLSNHPACAVRDIIQLSSPNIRPSYTPDSSVETAYAVINQAWISVYRNSSAVLERCSSMGMNATSLTTDRTQLTCPVCLASMRLVSLTGGNVDQEVPAALTDLNRLFPNPSLPKPPATATVVAAAAPNWYFRTAKSALNAVIGAVRSLFVSSTAGGNSTTAAVNATVTTEDTSLETVGTVTLGDAEVGVVGVDGIAVTVPESTAEAVAEAALSEIPADVTAGSSNSTVDAVAVEEVAEVASTPEPVITSLPMPPTVQFLSLRASQLRGVGFPIDHAAVVWCFDLLQAVTTGLRKLSKPHDPTFAPTDWAQVFPLSEQAALNSSASATLGSYEHHLQQRRHAQHAWTVAAHSESVYVTSKLPWPGVMGLAFDFVSSHLLKIVACYLIVSSLILTAPILRTLTGNCSGGHFAGATNWDALLPWNHFNADLMHAAVFSAIKTSVPPTMWRQIFTACYQLALFGVVVKAAYDYLFGTFELTSYAVYLHWVVAYFAALAIRAALLAFVQMMNATSVVLRGAGRTVLRYTVWCKPIRKTVRSTLKSVHELCAQRLPFYDVMQRSVGLAVVMALWLSVWVLAQQHQQVTGRELDRVTFGLSVLTLVSNVLLWWCVLAALLWPVNCNAPKKTRHHHHHAAHKTSPYHVDLLLLYLPALVLTLPMVQYSFRLLFGTSIVFPAAAELFGVFAQDQAVVVLATVAVAAHLYAARFTSALPANVKALRWMQEAVGPTLLLDYTDVFGATYTESSGTADQTSTAGTDGTYSTRSTCTLASGACLHEDGGKYAIFEEVLVTEQGVEKVQVADGVVLGSTYRVVSCNCAKDRSLVDQTEYCTWCRCRRCGGKNLPPDRTRYYTHAGAGSDSDLAELSDLSTDLLPIAALLLSVYLACCYVERSPYVYLRILGFIAAAFVSREVAHVWFSAK